MRADAERVSEFVGDDGVVGALRAHAVLGALGLPNGQKRARDLPDLVNYFVARYAQRSGKPLPMVAQDTMEVLMHYPWPGNIRQLIFAVALWGRAFSA